MMTAPQDRSSGATSQPSPIQYEDEDFDWILPDLSFEQTDSLDNCDSWGPFYLWRGKANPRQWPVSVAVTHEINPPWHHGVGVVVRGHDWWTGRSGAFATAVGIWWRGRPPRLLKDSPRKLSWQKVVNKSRRLS